MAKHHETARSIQAVETAGVNRRVHSHSVARSPFRFPGGKSRLLKFLRPAIDQILDGHDIYCEPFVGGGGPLLDTAALHPHIKLVANDLDFGIASFWHVVASNKYQELCDLVQGVDVTLETFRQYRSLDPAELPPVDAAFVKLFLNRTSFSGMGFRPLGGRSQTENSITSRWNPENLVARIERCHELLAGRLQVTNLHFSEVLSAHRCSPMYLDPPYIDVGLKLYENAMSLQEHRDLAATLLDRSNWVLSINDHPMVPSLYHPASLYRFPANYSITGTKTEHKKRSELLVTHRELTSPLPSGMEPVIAVKPAEAACP